MARLHIHPAGLGLLFLGLICWVVALAGLGASTKFCNDNRPEDSYSSYCANLYQLEWWSIWFEFFLLLVMLLTCFTNAFDKARFIYLTYLAMVTVLLSITAKNFITHAFTLGGFNIKDRTSDAYNAAAAGCILLCIVNYALIIFVGLGAAAAVNNGGVGGAISLSSAPEQKYQPSNF